MSTARVVVEAPGKAVLLGEYAVLDGAPALVAAFDRGVRCEAWADDVLHIETPGSNDTFVRPALEALAASGRFRLTAWNPPVADDKVGLGSSAAATVAAVEAAQALAGEVDRDEVFRVARRVHHDVQGGGSGIDVAASTYGGVLRYRPDRPEPLDVVVDAVIVWSGASARTGPRVQQYRAWPDRAAFVRDSEAVVDAFVEDPIRAMRAGRRLLEAMAAAAGIAYRTPMLDRIADLAEAHGGAGKPSGAGGGDIAVAILPDVEARAAFVAACAEIGAREVPVRVVGRG